MNSGPRRWGPAAVLLLGLCSLSAAAQPRGDEAFREGLAWLHSFEYEEALAAFQRAQQLDPGLALAWWGEALCYHQFLWLNEDPAMGRAVLARLAPTAEARAAQAAGPRERGYLAAADALFGQGDRLARVRAFADQMGRVARDFPDDPDAAAFHGLAILATAARGPEAAGHAGAGHGDPAILAGSETQAEAAAVFDRVLRDHPRHPGALHYLIHTWDDPAHAARALDAARVYPEVAPEASHALHMPAHIFVQLGLWQEAVASDERSFAASDAWVTRKGHPLALRDYHSLSWLTYAYLQRGQLRRTAETLSTIAPVAAEANDPRLKTLEATMQARVAVEADRADLARGPQYRNIDELFAIGYNLAKTGNPAHAEITRRALADTANQDRYRDRRTSLRLMERQVAALMHVRAGRGEDAVAAMREAMALDAELPPQAGPPQPIKPAAELFGEILLELGRPDEATAQFEAALKTTPNRSRSVLGLARAAARSNRPADARRHYEQFLDNWKDADPGRPELEEARAYLATSASLPAWLWVPGTFLVAGIAVLVVRKRRGQRPSGTSASASSRQRRARVKSPRAS